MNVFLKRNNSTSNDSELNSIPVAINRSTVRRRHNTTNNRLPETINENQIFDTPSTCFCCQPLQQINSFNFYQEQLPDIIVQHQPKMSTNVNFQNKQQSAIEKLASNLAIVYASNNIIENDVFLPGTQQKEDVNNDIKELSHLSDSSYFLNTPKILRCQLNTALYSYNCNSKTKFLINARRSASVSLPIDHETLRQVGISLRLISEEFHLKLQRNKTLSSKNKQNKILSFFSWCCKKVASKLPSISWQSNELVEKSENSLISADQPDLVPMVHLIIPVRQRCRSTANY